LECTSDLIAPVDWQPVFEVPALAGDALSVSLPIAETPKYFRLVQP